MLVALRGTVFGKKLIILLVNLFLSYGLLMNVELSYTAVCRNNQLFIFDALSNVESQTGRILHEDVTDFANSLGRYNYCTRYVIKDRILLVALLKALEGECKSGVLLPALHFECHGDEEKGLWLAASNEYVSWSDLAALIAPLNAAARNNIIVVLASCHGYALFKSVSINSPCPFHFMIAPNEEVSVGVIYDSIFPFYKHVIESGDLSTATMHLDQKFKLFISGEWFYSTIAAFLAHGYSSKVKSEMIEQMVTNAVEKAGYQNRELVRENRAKAKRYLSNPQVFYNLIAKLFFHGQVQVPFEDMKLFIEYQKGKL